MSTAYVLFEGVKRPAALLTTGDVTLLPTYEIMMVEPLHDLKNVINRVFEELPYSVSEPPLKQRITGAIELLKGESIVSNYMRLQLQYSNIHT